MNWKMPPRILISFGCDPRKVIRSILGWPRYLSDLIRYAHLHSSSMYSCFPLKISDLHPMLLDKRNSAGQMSIYFHQDLFVARQIYQRKPSKHLDIGSRIDGFISHLLLFMNVEIIDVRPLPHIEGLSCIQGDAMHLNEIPSDSIVSLSCLHALEHFGLGRYGDVINPAGWEKALSEMCRILAPGGVFYLSVPVGRERLEFNSQRVFSIATVLDKTDTLTLKSATFIDKTGILDCISDIRALRDLNSIIYEGGVSVFEFKKIALTADS